MAFARICLGITQTEFMEMTPIQFSSLYECRVARDRELIEFLDYGFSRLTAMVGNVGSVRFKEPLRPIDFMVSRRRLEGQRSKPARRKHIDRAALAAQWRSTLSHFLPR